MSEKVVWQMLQRYATDAGVPGIAPHDCRRSCAKLCRAAGGELEQIQLLLGHASVQTTERYLGTRQDLVHAPNDGIKLTVGDRNMSTVGIHRVDSLAGYYAPAFRNRGREFHVARFIGGIVNQQR